MCSGEETLMSIDTHSPSVAGFRCEAVTTDTIASPCLHSRLANIPRYNPMTWIAVRAIATTPPF